MALYDKSVRKKIYGEERVKNFIIVYDKFKDIKNDFNKNPEVHACKLIGEINEIRRIPKSLRLSLPYCKDSDLSELEKQCEKYIPE